MSVSGISSNSGSSNESTAGTGADRQLRAYERTGDVKRVVDLIVLETHLGLSTPPPATALAMA